MKSIKLRLPADYTEIDMAHLSEGIECLSFSAIRDENRYDSPWTAEWLLQDLPMDDIDFKSRIIVNAGRYNLTLPAPLVIKIEDVPERDWLAYSYQQFPAFSVGPFFIYGSHHDGGVPEDAFGLQIDAATAFGSGEHGTTAGCLEAMVELQEQGLCPWNVLDMGTGSGILAIAAWKLWKTPVLAVDNDPEAVRVSEHHRDINKVPGGGMDLTCTVGDGFAEDIVQKKAPYELVIANIMAGPLKDMAADLRSVCDTNAYVILSGILNEQAEDVIQVYDALGLRLRDHKTIREWSTLILHRAS